MAGKFWRRRNLIIAAVVVALSVGIVFASIPFLPAQNVPHGSLTSQQNVVVEPGSSSTPNVNVLVLPNLVTTESFYVGVSVINGTANFCVLRDTLYSAWVASGYTSTDCIGNTPTSGTTTDTLKFLPPVQGTYYVAALNYGSSKITVEFLPA